MEIFIVNYIVPVKLFHQLEIAHCALSNKKSKCLGTLRKHLADLPSYISKYQFPGFFS